MRRCSLAVLALALLLGSAAANQVAPALVSGMRAKFLRKHPLLAKHVLPPSVSGAPGSGITPTSVPAQCLSVAEVAQQAGNFTALLAAAEVRRKGGGLLLEQCGGRPWGKQDWGACPALFGPCFGLLSPLLGSCLPCLHVQS